MLPFSMIALDARGHRIDGVQISRESVKKSVPLAGMTGKTS